MNSIREKIRRERRNSKQVTNEYPVYEYYALCPTARYVGGTSRYLCECKFPHKCPGVKAASEHI